MRFQPDRRAVLGALTALFLTGVTNPLFADPPDAPAPRLIVPSGLATAPAFSADWTLFVRTRTSGDGMAKVGRGHTEVRRANGGSGADAVSFRGENELLIDSQTGGPFAKPQTVTVVYTPGQAVAYNAARGLYVRRKYGSLPYVPQQVSPWFDNSDAVVLGLGQLRPETTKEPTDGTLNGVPVNVYTCRTKLIKTPDGLHTGQQEWRYYYAKETNMPLGAGFFVISDGGEPRQFWELDITASNPLPSISDDRFVLDIPKTAAEWEPSKPKELLAAGTPAPDFTCIGADGQTVKLSDLKGKIVILDFWATWCGPCQKSMPHLERVYRAVKDKDVAVLALCVSDARKPYDKWCITHKTDYSFPVAYDPAGMSPGKSISFALFNVKEIPTQFVIDKDGKVAAALVGYDDGDQRLETELAKLGVNVPAETKTASK